MAKEAKQSRNFVLICFCLRTRLDTQQQIDAAEALSAVSGLTFPFSSRESAIERYRNENENFSRARTRAYESSLFWEVWPVKSRFVKFPFSWYTTNEFLRCLSVCKWTWKNICAPQQITDLSFEISFFFEIYFCLSTRDRFSRFISTYSLACVLFHAMCITILLMTTRAAQNEIPRIVLVNILTCNRR